MGKRQSVMHEMAGCPLIVEVDAYRFEYDQSLGIRYQRVGTVSKTIRTRGAVEVVLRGSACIRISS
jgi:hypothetical protein